MRPARQHLIGLLIKLLCAHMRLTRDCKAAPRLQRSTPAQRKGLWGWKGSSSGCRKAGRVILHFIRQPKTTFTTIFRESSRQQTCNLCSSLVAILNRQARRCCWLVTPKSHHEPQSVHEPPIVSYTAGDPPTYDPFSSLQLSLFSLQISPQKHACGPHSLTSVLLNRCANHLIIHLGSD